MKSGVIKSASAETRKEQQIWLMRRVAVERFGESAKREPSGSQTLRTKSVALIRLFSFARH